MSDTYENNSGVRVLRAIEKHKDVDVCDINIEHHMTGKRYKHECDPKFPMNIHAIQGPPGCEGPRGEDGRDGQQGVQGTEGDKGEVGPIGLTGPDGRDGKDGIQGIQGIQGEQGLQGVPGMDALISFDVVMKDGVACGKFTFNTPCGPKTIQLPFSDCEPVCDSDCEPCDE